MSNQNIAAVNKEGCSSTISAENKSITIRYEECNKNHGARLGKDAKDGCKEFMAGNLDELKCDACDCHRNFHRKRTVKDDGPKASSEVWYEDCCKNHALQYGKYSSRDGCLEFMAGEGDEGSRDVLMCDACGCHRNFHNKREEEEEKGVRMRASPPSYVGGAAYDSDEYYD